MQLLKADIISNNVSNRDNNEMNDKAITPPSPIDLSIIIVSWNTKDILRDCLRSIRQSEWRGSYEIIVVDNHSQDGSPEMIKEEFKEVVLIENQDNRLFAIANNQGARVAKGRYLLLLNSDTLVYGDNLQKMVDFFDRQPSDVICVGPKVLNKDHTLQSCGWPTGKLMLRIVLGFKLHWLLPVKLVRALLLPTLPLGENVTCSVGWVVGACMMMDARKYKEVGGLSERIEFYGEEPEFGYRTYYKYGYKTMYYADAEIIHLGGQSTSKTHIDEEVSLRRYSLLVKETVGLKTGINQSRIVVVAGYLKRMLSSNKQYFTDAINYEKRVIAYLKKCK